MCSLTQAESDAIIVSISLSPTLHSEYILALQMDGGRAVGELPPARLSCGNLMTLYDPPVPGIRDVHAGPGKQQA